MSFSDIPLWTYVVVLWYGSGVYAVGAIFAAMVHDGQSLPASQRYFVWVLALTGIFLIIYVRRIGDLGKGFVLSDRAVERLKNKLQRP